MAATRYRQPNVRSLLLADIPPSAHLEMAKFLDVGTYANWEMLAEAMGMQPPDIAVCMKRLLS